MSRRGEVGDIVRGLNVGLRSLNFIVIGLVTCDCYISQVKSQSPWGQLLYKSSLFCALDE